MAAQDSRQQGRTPGAATARAPAPAVALRRRAGTSAVQARRAGASRARAWPVRRARAEPSRYIAEPAPPSAPRTGSSQPAQCRLKAQAPGGATTGASPRSEIPTGTSLRLPMLSSPRSGRVGGSPADGNFGGNTFTDPRTAEMTAFNQQLEPSLAGLTDGVCALRVAERMAVRRAPAAALARRRLRCAGAKVLPRVLAVRQGPRAPRQRGAADAHAAPHQRYAGRSAVEVAGFQQMEDELVTWLHGAPRSRRALLRPRPAGPQYARSTGFDIHQDTRSSPSSPSPSSSRSPTRPPRRGRCASSAPRRLDYDAAGAAGCRAALHHASSAPPSAGRISSRSSFAPPRRASGAKRGLSEARSDLEVAQPPRRRVGAQRLRLRGRPNCRPSKSSRRYELSYRV